MAFLGAILLVVCVFTPWLGSKGSSGHLTGWEMVTKKDKAGALKSPDPAILLGIAAATLAIAGLLIAGISKTLMRVLLILAGVGAGAVLVRDYLSIKDTVKKDFPAGVKVTYQYGFWLGVAAAVILLVAALMPSRKRT